MRADCARVAIDLEGFVDYVSCIGFATTHNTAFVVPFMRADGTSWWSEDEEVQLWEAVAAVLEDILVAKVLQNSLYDCFVLAWSYGIVIENIIDDTMLKHFELFCELPKNLGFQTSIYTAHPAYKHQRKSTDERVQLIYCGQDCCRTLECCDAQEAMLKPRQREHYRFNLSLLPPLLYMELRGIRYDAEAAAARLNETQTAIYELQDEINREAARGRPELHHYFAALENPDTAAATSSLMALLADAFCCAPSLRREKRQVIETTWQPMRHNGKRWVKAGKRLDEATLDATIGPEWIYDEEAEPGPRATPWLKPHHKNVERSFAVEIATVVAVKRFAKASCKAELASACRILAEARNNGALRLSAAQRGQLATLLNIHIKVNATDAGGDAQWYLYTHCKLPPQFQKDGNKLTDRLATDDEALIKAYLASGKDDASRDQRAMRFLDLRRLITQTKTLSATADADGRIRCGYNLVGTDTHRLTCYESPTGSGYNLQTVTKKHRDLFCADEGCYIGQRDLSGADGWTVAAYAAMLGDRTMLDDYKFKSASGLKLKPAQIIVLMLDRDVSTLSREELAPLCAPITEEADWRYFGMKRVQHGGSYQMGKRTMSDQILTDSFKKDGRPILIEPAQCERILNGCFFVRYAGVRRWHEWMATQISTEGALTASNGFTRRFFGRKDDKATVRAALGHLPQVYTTYATTLALSRLWSDPDNRRDNGSLRIEPLHTVHDSLLSQWPIDITEWAKLKLRVWFDNEMLIAQERITIPASGTYGVSWGAQTENL